MRRARRWPVALALCAAGVVSGGWATFQWVYDAAAAGRSDASFYGAVNARWDGRLVADARDRQFPGVIAGPDAVSDGGRAHTVRLPFRGEPGYRVELHIVQADSNASAPPALQLSLNGGDAVTLATQPGSGRDPVATERASPHEYHVELPRVTICGDNVVQLTAASGTWIAIERIDVRLRRRPAVMATAMIAALLLLASGVVATVSAMQTVRLRQFAKRSVLAVAAIAMALVMSEAALRVLSRYSVTIKRLLYVSTDAAALPDTPEIFTALAAHRCAESPCSVYDDGFRLNRHGFHTTDYRYEKPTGTTRVVGIGDSFLFYTGQIPYEEAFFHRVEVDATRAAGGARTEFINLGMLCIGISSERALLFQEGLRLSPDLVVWTIYLGNDITDEAADNVREARETTTNSALYRLATHVADLAIHDPKLLVSGCGARAEDTKPGATPRACGYLERSHSDVPYDPNAKTLSDERYLLYGSDRLRTMYAAAAQQRIRELAGAIARQFRDVRDRVGSEHVIFVVIPDQFQVSPAEVDRIVAADASLRGDRFDFDYTSEVMPKMLAGLGFDVVDLTPPFRDAIQAGVNPYQPNDGHLSVAGSRLVATHLESALRRKGMKFEPH